eukprot:TRINITY_DN5026_c0_g1_i4.p2 TRINITY_DN5026_c0_g1~~TRINITY_DN5026_c0_g1_i4.p2  ORF type:complete len:135 (-),score=48.11 TRINITY_DN5026_c0_g1_i4:505-909(-)
MEEEDVESFARALKTMPEDKWASCCMYEPSSMLLQLAGKHAEFGPAVLAALRRREEERQREEEERRERDEERHREEELCLHQAEEEFAARKNVLALLEEEGELRTKFLFQPFRRDASFTAALKFAVQQAILATA